MYLVIQVCQCVSPVVFKVLSRRHLHYKNVLLIGLSLSLLTQANEMFYHKIEKLKLNSKITGHAKLWQTKSQNYILSFAELKMHLLEISNDGDHSASVYTL